MAEARFLPIPRGLATDGVMLVERGNSEIIYLSGRRRWNFVLGPNWEGLGTPRDYITTDTEEDAVMEEAGEMCSEGKTTTSFGRWTCVRLRDPVAVGGDARLVRKDVGCIVGSQGFPEGCEGDGEEGWIRIW